MAADIVGMDGFDHLSKGRLRIKYDQFRQSFANQGDKPEGRYFDSLFAPYDRGHFIFNSAFDVLWYEFSLGSAQTIANIVVDIFPARSSGTPHDILWTGDFIQFSSGTGNSHTAGKRRNVIAVCQPDGTIEFWQGRSNLNGDIFPIGGPTQKLGNTPAGTITPGEYQTFKFQVNLGTNTITVTRNALPVVVTRVGGTDLTYGGTVNTIDYVGYAFNSFGSIGPIFDNFYGSRGTDDNGSVQVVTLWPLIQTVNEWALSIGTNAAALLDERHRIGDADYDDADTSYLSNSTAAIDPKTALFQCDPLLVADGTTIYAVQINVVGRSEHATDPVSLSILARDPGGTVWQSAVMTFPGGGDYVSKRVVYVNAPSGGVWAPDTFNLWRFGFRNHTDGVTARVTQLAVEVMIPPGIGFVSIYRAR